MYMRRLRFREIIPIIVTLIEKWNQKWDGYRGNNRFTKRDD